MLYAKNERGQLIEASPRRIGYCPGCGAQLRPKCGSIKIHHWAHLGKDCDPWSEPETAWHKGWKEIFPMVCREVAMGEHRADLRLPNGLVIELQHSSISPDDIAAREAFYGNMIWLFDAQPFAKYCQTFINQQGCDWLFNQLVTLNSLAMPENYLRMTKNKAQLERDSTILKSLKARRDTLCKANPKAVRQAQRFVDIHTLKSRTIVERYSAGIKSRIEGFLQWFPSNEVFLVPRIEVYLRDFYVDSHETAEDAAIMNDLTNGLLDPGLTRANVATILEHFEPALEIVVAMAAVDTFELNCNLLQQTAISSVNKRPLWNGYAVDSRCITFRWLRPRKTMLFCTKPMFWDIGASNCLVYFEKPDIQLSKQLIEGVLVNKTHIIQMLKQIK